MALRRGVNTLKSKAMSPLPHQSCLKGRFPSPFSAQHHLGEYSAASQMWPSIYSHHISARASSSPEDNIIRAAHVCVWGKLGHICTGHSSQSTHIHQNTCIFSFMMCKDSFFALYFFIMVGNIVDHERLRKLERQSEMGEGERQQERERKTRKQAGCGRM